MGERVAKTENARRLRSIHFIDLEDQDYKETIKKVRRKLEVPMDAAMLCKKRAENTSSLRETVARFQASKKVPKTKYNCTVEYHESTRQRLEPSLPKLREHYIAGKGANPMSLCWYTIFSFAEGYKKSLMRRQQWRRNGSSLKQFQRDS